MANRPVAIGLRPVALRLPPVGMPFLTTSMPNRQTPMPNPPTPMANRPTRRANRRRRWGACRPRYCSCRSQSATSQLGCFTVGPRVLPVESHWPLVNSELFSDNFDAPPANPDERVVNSDALPVHSDADLVARDRTPEPDKPWPARQIPGRELATCTRSLPVRHLSGFLGMFPRPENH